MANVMDGIAFDSYCIHYDTSIMTMKETLHLLNAVSITQCQLGHQGEICVL
jgi:hypothetical protein